MADPKEQAHELIERLAPRQVSAVVSLLETMLDPVSRAIGVAPAEDEPDDPSENQAVAQSKTWFAAHGYDGIPHEEVLAEFGLTVDDVKVRKNQT